MTTLNSIVEILATIVETFSWVALCLHLSNVLKEKFWWRIIIGCALDTLLVYGMNQIKMVSFLTPLLTMVLFALYSRIVGREKLLICASAAVVTVTVMAAIDYILFFLFGIVSENAITDSHTFMSLMSPGLPRYLYLLTAKSTQILLAFYTIRKLPTLKKLRLRDVGLLLVFSSIFYAMMTHLVSTILSDSIWVLQTAVILSLVFILVCIIVMLLVFFISADHRAEQETNSVLSAVNALTEENYQKLNALQKELSKQNHDFGKHVQTIHELIREENLNEALGYTEELLKIPAQRTKLCRSGNSVIDAILNTKISEVEQKQIGLEFQVNFAIPTNIDSVDICTILGNQLDNAIEACEKIDDCGKRHINVHIYQQMGNIAVFQVSNTVSENPFLHNAKLRSTKSSSKLPHGLGIQNIRETAEKYQGILENSYQDGKFISSVLLYFTPQVST